MASTENVARILAEKITVAALSLTKRNVDVEEHLFPHLGTENVELLERKICENYLAFYAAFFHRAEHSRIHRRKSVVGKHKIFVRAERHFFKVAVNADQRVPIWRRHTDVDAVRNLVELEFRV